jgi:crossover junction endodeoxyribonuclease RuvC
MRALVRPYLEGDIRERLPGRGDPLIYLGIDPGLKGGLAFLHPDFDGQRPAFVFDTPSVTVSRNGKNRSEYLIENMRDILMREGRDACESFAILESVHAMPGQGATSMFSFGRGLGIWEGLLVGCGIPYAKIAPQTWKKAMMPDMARDNKDSSRIAAMRLFPKLSEQLARKKDDGRAEALLLAEYGRRLKG